MDTKYIFHQKYILFPVEDTTGNLLRWYLTRFDEDRALRCFTTVYGNLQEVRNHINKIEDYITKFEQTFAEKTDPPVKMHTDEANNYTGIKTIETGRQYEVLHVRHNGYGGAGYVHTVVFIDEYNLIELNELVNDYGYANFTAFLLERNIPINDVIIGTNVDYRSNGWYQVAEELVCFVAESEDGRAIASDRAERLAKRFGIPFAGETE